jgi:hypothetical protein
MVVYGNGFTNFSNIWGKRNRFGYSLSILWVQIRTV